MANDELAGGLDVTLRPPDWVAGLVAFIDGKIQDGIKRQLAQRLTRADLRRLSKYPRLEDLAAACGADPCAIARLEKRPAARWQVRQRETAEMVARALRVPLEDYLAAEPREGERR